MESKIQAILRSIQDWESSKETNIKPYHTEEFARIRKSLGIFTIISSLEYWYSPDVCGKSGSLVFRTHDHRFTIKSIRETELSTLDKMIKSLERHMCGPTFITPMIGCFRIDGSVYIVICTVGNGDICTIYDLKGSNRSGRSVMKEIEWENTQSKIDVGRIEMPLWTYTHSDAKMEGCFTNEETKSRLKPINEHGSMNKFTNSGSQSIESNTTNSNMPSSDTNQTNSDIPDFIRNLKPFGSFKDSKNSNLEQLNNLSKLFHHMKTSEKIEYIKLIISRDANFLTQFGVMDYSLLVICSTSQKTLTNQSGTHCSFRKRCRGSVFLGIIDILTFFTHCKKCEYTCNILCFCNSGSCVTPEEYSRRFIKMVDEDLFDEA